MSEDNEIPNEQRMLAQTAHDNGGVLLIPQEDGGVRAIIAIDQKNPERIFDRLNEIEVELVTQAGHDLEKIKNASEWIDDLRARVRMDCASMGLDIPS
jgi:hypothetical protein